MSDRRYLVLDSKGFPLAHALLDSPHAAPIWRLRLLDSEASPAVSEHQIVQLAGMNAQTPDKVGRILKVREGDLTVELTDSLGGELRQNLRIPVRFQSYVYPVSGSWGGRLPVESCDLSCGGVAFFCSQELQVGEIVEIVIPVTARPLLLNVKILKCHPSPSSAALYSAKFMDMIPEIETMVQEAVFGLQLKNRACAVAPGLNIESI